MADEELAVNLKVLSPSTEIEGGAVSLPNLPASTTVRELRSRIQEAVSTKPAPERMRLIYRGRVVANDADTLSSVLGADNIRESKDQSLHLVLRELPPDGSAASSPAPRSSTAPPNPFRPAPSPNPPNPALQTNPFRTIPQPRPNSQPVGVPHHHHHPHAHHHHHHHHQQQHQHVPGAANPFPVPFPPALQQQLAHLAARPGGPLNPAQPVHPQTEENGRVPTPANPAPAAPIGLPPFAPPSGRTVHREGVGPDGQRWSVTYSTSSEILGAQLQQPNLAPPSNLPNPLLGHAHLPADVPVRPVSRNTRDRSMFQLRNNLNRVSMEIANARTLQQMPHHASSTGDSSRSSSTPAWRLDYFQRHVRDVGPLLELVGQMVNLFNVQFPNDPEVASFRETLTRLRADFEQLKQTLVTQGYNLEPTPREGQRPSSSSILPQIPVASTSAVPDLQNVALQTLPPGLPEELFLLSSPQGPVGVLFNQQGTYTTAPLTPTLPFQTFADQFARNRQIISGIGQNVAHQAQLHHQLANVRPTPTTAQPAANNTAVPPQAQGQQQAQPQQDQNHNVGQPAAPQPEDDRIGNIAGHLWLLFKLAVFVYFFSGGGSWYKSVLIGLIAGGVYLAQLGIFDEHLAIIRRHFEAVLPVGALAERALQNRRPAHQANQPQPGRNFTPEEAAQRLLQEHRGERLGWARETMRTMERSVAIFLASLWPGIGEQMVHAQEERDRQERVAEQERREAEEERRRKEAEEKENSESKEATGVEGEEGESSSSLKGKERADTATEEAQG